MKNIAAYAVSFGLVFSPYLVVSWGYMNLTDGKSNSFWIAMGVLVGIRSAFGVIEFCIGVIRWRLFGQKFAVQVILSVLKSNNFPMRDQRSYNFSSYLFWITEDYQPKPSPQRAAKEMQDMLLFLDEFTGWGLWSWRLTSAGEKALEIYSPRALVEKNKISSVE